MRDEHGTERGEQRSKFEALPEEKPLSLPREFLLFVIENKKWWMIPILIVITLVGVLMALGATGAAPFIYPLF